MTKLTIGLATYDDFDGVWFTIQSLRLHHAEVMDRVEFLILDNNPTSKHGQAVERFSKWLRPQDRLLSVTDITGTVIKYRLFAEARTDYLLYLDCHVLVTPGAVAHLLALFDSGAYPGALMQGPLVMDNLTQFCTHFNPVWSGGMWGVWAEDPRGQSPESEPFDIPSQGMGLFACRVEDWLGFNPHFRGFGGEEGYVHTKFHQAGRRTLCLPWLRWMHRFERPAGIPYRNIWEDRIFNYALGHLELGLPLDEMTQHFESLKLGHLVPACIEEAKRKCNVDSSTKLC